MMFAMNGWESTVDGFLYVLAERLHKTVAELRALPNRELVEWQSYFKAQAAIREVQR